MSTAKSLTEEQIATIKAWADDGDGLSDIQRKLADELEVKITYLETRFLLEDLKIEIKPVEVPEPEANEEEEPEEEEAVSEEEAEPAGEGSVSVTVDKVQRPGAIVSGKVSFGLGKSASWWLDQMGRLGFEPDQEGFTPSEEEAIAFQQQLQQVLQQQQF